MASVTINLGLSLPGLGEFTDVWDQPLNENLTKIDAAVGAIRLELVNARFGTLNLATFLTVGHNTDGTLKPTAEVQSARNSFLYGNKNSLSLAYDLPSLSKERDREVWKARANAADLRDSLAFRAAALSPSMVISGSNNANGYPTWAGFTGAKVQVDGSVKPVIFMIDGQIAQVRLLKEVTLTGAAGTYFIYADYQADGVQNISRPSGLVGFDTSSEVRVLEDSGYDFTVQNLKAGDVLHFDTGPNLGDYIIDEVAYDSSVSKLRIRGVFPSASGGPYKTRDPLGVTLGFASAQTVLAGRVFIAEADFDGTAVTAVRARHFKTEFVGEWRSINVSTTSTFEEIWNHNLGTDKLDVTIQVSQANDGSLPVEELSLTQFRNTLGVSTALGTLAGTVAASGITVTPGLGTLAVASAVSASDPAHTHSLTGVPAVVLSGTPAVSFTGIPASITTGVITPENSAIMKCTRNKIQVKNAVASSFYKDYDGVVRTGGYLRVILTKKG